VYLPVGSHLLRVGEVLTDTGSNDGSGACAVLDRLLANAAAIRAENEAFLNRAGQLVGWSAPGAATSAAAPATTAVTSQLPGVEAGDDTRLLLDSATVLEVARQVASALGNDDLLESLDELERRNERIGRLQEAVEALEAYRDDPTPERWATAREAAGAAELSGASEVPPTGARLDSLVTRAGRSVELEAAKQQVGVQSVMEQVVASDEYLDALAALLSTRLAAGSSVVAAMHSDPVALGTVEWNGTGVEGDLDMAGVPAGDHHLVLDFVDAGFTVVQDVTVSDPDTRTAAEPVSEGGGSGLFPGVVLGVVAAALALAVLVLAVVRRRRRPA